MFPLHRILLWITAVSVFAGTSASADNDLERYFEGMRSRRLYRLAEDFGKSQLADPNLADDQRVRLTIELARTYADHATQSNPSDEAAYWQKARGVLRDLAERDLSLPLRLLAELQWAVTDLAQGEANRWRGDLLPEDDGLKRAAQDSLRNAIDRLESIRGMVAESEPGGRPNRAAPSPREGHDEALSASQRRSLLRNVDLHQAHALMNLAQTYAPGSADRLDALNRATALLNPLTGARSEEETAWSSFVDLAECQRLMGNLDEARRALDEIFSREPPAGVLDRALALRARLLLAGGEVDAAVALLEDHRRALSEPSDELEYLYIEALLTKWRSLGPDMEATAEELRDRLTNLIRQLRTRNSGYWARRAELLLARDVREGTVDGGLPLLVSTAESLYRSARYTESAEVYAEAAQQAEVEGRADQAFDLGFTRAAVLTQAQQFGQASAAFRTLAVQHPSHPRAAEAHLMSAYTQGRLLASQPTAANQQTYRRILEEHLARFAESETTGEAHWLLGRLEESLRQFREALAHYQRVPLSHPRAGQTLEAADRCLKRWMQQQVEAGASSDEVLAKAASFFQQVFRESRPLVTSATSQLHRDAGLRLARIWLSASSPRYREAERVLDQLLAELRSASASDSIDPNWLREVHQLLIVSLAGQGQMTAAEEQLRQTLQGDPGEALELLVALDDVGATTDSVVQRSLGELQLQLIERLGRERHRFDAAARFKLDRAEARALARAGRTDDALAAFNRLKAQRPDDVTLLEAHGELLMSLDRPETYEAAGAIWRELESKVPPESQPWFRARYNLALSYYKLGDLARCHKLVGVTRVLHPELGGAELKQRFDALWHRSQPDE